MAKKFLIIEDEPLIQMSLKMLLEKKGADVIATNSGKEAINLINQNEFNKIICDLMLKDITGFDVIEESKGKYSNDEIKEKFVIMTAYSSSQILEKAGKYGCRIIRKPFNDDINETLNIFFQSGA